MAAGTVIPEGMVIPPRSLVIGVPGRIRRAIEAEDFALIEMYAQNYLEYTELYRRET